MYGAYDPDDGSFTPDGRGDYISIGKDWSPSPAYAIINAAKRIIDDGHTVTVPNGYTREALDGITWKLGYRNSHVRVEGKHAQEFRQIAEELRTNHNAHLNHDERDATTNLMRGVTP